MLTPNPKYLTLTLMLTVTPNPCVLNVSSVEVSVFIFISDFSSAALESVKLQQPDNFRTTLTQSHTERLFLTMSPLHSGVF